MDLITNDAPITVDPFEAEYLDESHLDLVEPCDPYYREITQISTEMASIRRRTRPKRLRIAEALFSGQTKAEVARQLKTSYSTIKAALAHPDIKQYLALTERRRRLREGPSLEARAAMLWRIANREENNAPSVAIKAIDTLNKQGGVYMGETQGEGGLNILVQNFISSPQTPPSSSHEKDVTPTARPASDSAVLEGDFTPVTVDVSDD